MLILLNLPYANLCWATSIIYHYLHLYIVGGANISKRLGYVVCSCIIKYEVVKIVKIIWALMPKCNSHKYRTWNETNLRMYASNQLCKLKIVIHFTMVLEWWPSFVQCFPINKSLNFMVKLMKFWNIVLEIENLKYYCSICRRCMFFCYKNI